MQCNDVEAGNITGTAICTVQPWVIRILGSIQRPLHAVIVQICFVKLKQHKLQFNHVLFSRNNAKGTLPFFPGIEEYVEMSVDGITMTFSKIVKWKTWNYLFFRSVIFRLKEELVTYIYCE